MGSKKRIKTNTTKPPKHKFNKNKKLTMMLNPTVSVPHLENNKLIKKLSVTNNLKLLALITFLTISFCAQQRFTLWAKKETTKPVWERLAKDQFRLKQIRQVRQRNPRFKLLLYTMFALNTININLKKELQVLFLLTSNKQQYFLNSLGVNFFFFNTYSSGRCLRTEFEVKTSKALKKSPKLNKALVEYYFFGALHSLAHKEYSHTFLKPFNKKALILLTQIQSNSNYYFTDIGFSKYYKINFKRTSRIKKRIKKKLLIENFSYKIT